MQTLSSPVTCQFRRAATWCTWIEQPHFVSLPKWAPQAFFFFGIHWLASFVQGGVCHVQAEMRYPTALEQCCILTIYIDRY